MLQANVVFCIAPPTDTGAISELTAERLTKPRIGCGLEASVPTESMYVTVFCA